MHSRLEAAIEAACVAQLCDGSVQLGRDVTDLEAALTEAGVSVQASSDEVIASVESAPDAFGRETVRRVFVAAENGAEDALMDAAARFGFSGAVTGPLGCLRVVARNPRRVTPEFWRRIFAWIDVEPALRKAVLYAELLATSLLPASAGERVLVVCERDVPSYLGSKHARASKAAGNGRRQTDAQHFLADAGGDVDRVAAEIARLLANEPRAGVLAWFVSATVCSPRFDEVVARLFPAGTLQQFERWTRCDALDRNVTEIVRTWHKFLIAPDLLNYRGLDLGYALEYDAAKEMLRLVHFSALEDIP